MLTSIRLMLTATAGAPAVVSEEVVDGELVKHTLELFLALIYDRVIHDCLHERTRSAPQSTCSLATSEISNRTSCRLANPGDPEEEVVLTTIDARRVQAHRWRAPCR